MIGAADVRYWSKVEKTQGCWLWKAAKNSAGYGQFSIRGKLYYAHRVSYELENGPIPEHLELDHLCRNRACVRPEHLEAVTRRVNQLRGASPTSDNARRTHCRRGHPLPPPNKHGKRQCMVCNRDYCAARRARLRRPS